MNEKPWDKLRVPVVPTRPPIAPGLWVGETPFIYFKGGSQVDRKKYVLAIGNEKHEVHFTATGLRQLAEFCTELADQLEARSAAGEAGEG